MSSDDLEAEAELPPVQIRQRRKPVDAGAQTRGSKYFFQTETMVCFAIFHFLETHPRSFGPPEYLTET